MRLVLLTLVVLLMQFPVILVPWNEVDFGRSIVFLADLPLAALALAVAPALWRDLRAGSLGGGTACWAVAAAVLVAAFAAHPSTAGAQIVLRAIGALAVAYAVSRTERREEQTFVVVALAVTTILQSALGAAQVIRGGPLGLTALGELSDPLHERNASLAPRGTMVYTYDLAALGLLAAARLTDRALAASRPVAWTLAAALAVTSVGFTYSRSAVAGLVTGILALVRGALAGRRSHALAMLALLVGAGIPAVVWNDGWLGRVRQTLPSDVPARAQDRQAILLQGMEIVVDAPLTGVGPGRYVPALRERLARDAEALPVHSTPVLIAAEAGVAAGVAVLVLLVVTGWGALRAGAPGILLYVVIAPFVVADQFLYTTAQGLVLFGVWIGSLDLLMRRAATPPATSR